MSAVALRRLDDLDSIQTPHPQPGRPPDPLSSFVGREPEIAAARVAVTVPTAWRVTDQVLVLGARRAIRDSGGDAGAPLLRLRGTSLAGSLRLSQG